MLAHFQDAHGYVRRRRVVLQMGGRSWTVSLKTAKQGGQGRGHRTSFRYGWRKFCVDNGLDVGDTCLFRVFRERKEEDEEDEEEDEDDEHVLKVEVHKKDGSIVA